MKINVLTLFPEMIENIAKESILGKAVEAGFISINAVNIRDYTQDKHNRVDDYTYGGGAGMLIQAQPVYDCYMNTVSGNKGRCIYVTPQGRPFTQRMAQSFAQEEELTIICGHYEGIDERVLEEVVTDYVSIGDYVLTGGELAAMVITDAVARLVPEVLGNGESAEIESFHRNLLEYPQYTRPAVWHEKEVPEVLFSGDPKKVEAWRYEKSLERTRQRRPDLYELHIVEQEILNWLSQFKRDFVFVSEPLRRGLCEILVWDADQLVILRDPVNYNTYIVCSEFYDLEDILDDELIDEIKEDMITVFYENQAKLIAAKCGLDTTVEYLEYVYTAKEKKSVASKHDIRPLTLEHLDYVNANYEEDEDYCTKLLKYGMLYGYFLDDKLVGFVGNHFMGCAGVLFVDEAYRRQGIAKVLVQFIINKTLEKGETLYCFVEKDNEPSHNLQKAMGMFPASKNIYTVF